ncbi:predicted protein [Histoplasma capsulatum H143]|uniref:Uncharacterized protein n=1 Tax=Ajellomyces capsulatus (strain H143) TaxID=544712 RepID=C6HCH4_AJECH|nr:predicted protein [Histoplasma capsulatum H143]
MAAEYRGCLGARFGVRSKFSSTTRFSPKTTFFPVRLLRKWKPVQRRAQLVQRSGGIKSMQSIATLYPVEFINHFRSSISITVIHQTVMDTGDWICTQRFAATLLGLRP